MLTENGGGLKRLRGLRRLLGRRRVGERPAGAEAGVGLMNVSRRGDGIMEGVLTRGPTLMLDDVTGVTCRLYRLDLEMETSSSKADRLRLCSDSRMLGSTFSLSEPPSGETARRLRDVGAEFGVIAETRISEADGEEREAA